MWTPDVRTLFLIIFLVNVSLALMMFIYGKTQKTYYGFMTWTISLLIFAGGYFLFMLRGSIPDLLSIVVANNLLFLSVIMRVDGLRRFISSKALPAPVYGILLPAVVLFLYFTFVTDSIMIRYLISIVIISACTVTAIVYILTAIYPESRSLRIAIVAVLVLITILFVFRMVFWLFVPADNSLFSTSIPNTTFFIVNVITDILFTGTFLMLNMARAQEEIGSSETRYRNLADNLPDYIIVHDGESIRYANPAITRLAGIAPVSLAGQSIYSLLSQPGATEVREFIRETLAGNSLVSYCESDLRFHAGTIHHCIVKTVRINDQGKLSSLSVITDISEQKAAENALFQTNRKLSILSSITRHDIMNQLLGLKGYLDLSKDSLDDRSAMEEYIRWEEQIADTIGRQIEFTKIYENMGVHAPVWQNVELMVRHAIAALPLRRVGVIVDRPDLEVYADPLVEKVFYNLIDNALRYGGGEMKTIGFSCRETEAGLILACEDDGEGIRGEDKAHLFEQGYGKNTGLGLFLTREILSITGIVIAETSEHGKGARFEMLVPKGAYRFVQT
jgi:PAS domain S-box-containing protein